VSTAEWHIQNCPFHSTRRKGLPAFAFQQQADGVTLKPWKWPLANQILVGLLVGAVAGLIVEQTVTDAGTLAQLDWWLANVIKPVGSLFIRIIFMIVIPLIFAAIVLGIAEMGDVRELGKVGVKSVLFTLLLAGTSVLLGLVLVNVFSPGSHLSEATKSELTAKYGGAVATKVEQGDQEGPTGRHAARAGASEPPA
jgi:DAACS family dicarboxylate/amino acid:cation (Na+ or H+) symporter